MPSLASLANYLQQNICPQIGETCFARALNLQNADFLDLDYDTTSQTLVLTSFWHASSAVFKGWTERITNLAGRAKVEVGVLANEQAVKVEELSMGGYLAVIGEDKQLSRLHRRYLLRCIKKSTRTHSFLFPLPSSSVVFRLWEHVFRFFQFPNRPSSKSATTYSARKNQNPSAFMYALRVSNLAFLFVP